MIYVLCWAFTLINGTYTIAVGQSNASFALVLLATLTSRLQVRKLFWYRKFDSWECLFEVSKIAGSSVNRTPLFLGFRINLKQLRRLFWLTGMKLWLTAESFHPRSAFQHKAGIQILSFVAISRNFPPNLDFKFEHP